MGAWKIDFQAAGTYEFVFRKGTLSTPQDLTMIRKGNAYVAIGDERFQFGIDGPVTEIKLPVKVAHTGVQMVECWFEGQRADGKPSGAYFVEITRIK
jgi:hypothetical protein